MVIIIKEKYENDFVIYSDIEEGFLKGNMFPLLYDKYKFEPNKYNFKNDYDNTIYMIEVYSFLNIELSMYLCNHPNDKKASELLLRANSERDKLIEYVSIEYGGLSQYSVNNTKYFNLKFPWDDLNV